MDVRLTISSPITLPFSFPFFLFPTSHPSPPPPLYASVGRWLEKNSFVYETGLGTVCDLAFSPHAGKTELALGTDTGTIAVIGVDLDKVGTGSEYVSIQQIMHLSRSLL